MGPASPKYWRGLVMWHCEGLDWRAPYAPASFPIVRHIRERDGIRQRITSHRHWGPAGVFGWIGPLNPSGAMCAWKLSVQRSAGFENRGTYEVLSSTGPIGRELRPHELGSASMPRPLARRWRELQHPWHTRSRATGDRGRALQFFRTQGSAIHCHPAIQQERSGGISLSFVERAFANYASSFATLMRLAGIPARVVVGYLGGESMTWAGLSRAPGRHHAECEVWFRMDGRESINQRVTGRASLDFSSFLAASRIR